MHEHSNTQSKEKNEYFEAKATCDSQFQITILIGRNFIKKIHTINSTS